MSRHAGLSTRLEHAGTIFVVALLREELGRRIAAARQAAGLTQQQLADQIGLRHAQDVSRYERGKIEVPGSRIDLIAEATGRARSYFVRDPAEAEIPPPLAADEIREVVREEVSAALEEIEAMLARLLDRAPPESDAGADGGRSVSR